MFLLIMTYIETKPTEDMRINSLFLEVKELKNRIRNIENTKAEYEDFIRLEKKIKGDI